MNTPQEKKNETHVAPLPPNTLRTMTESKHFRTVLWSVGGLFVASLIFHAGMEAGYHKARYSYQWGDQYSRSFEGGKGGPGQGDRGGWGMMGMMREGDFFSAHGSVGSIKAISLPTLVIVGKDNAERIVRITDDTEIRGFHDELTEKDLMVGTYIVVLGDPNDTAEIEAKLIRILPPPPSMPMMGTATPMMGTTSAL